MVGHFGFGGRGRRSGRRFWPGGYVISFFTLLYYIITLCGYEKRKVEVMILRERWGRGGGVVYGSG